MARNFEVDLVGVDGATQRALREELARAVVEQERRAQVERDEIGRLNAETVRSLDGLGEVRYRMHPVDRWQAAVHLGIDPRDAEGQRWIAKKLEYAQVKSRRTKTGVGYEAATGGGRGEAREFRRGARWVKVYG